MSAIIEGDTIIFRNRYGKNDITLKHEDEKEGYKLVFDSGVIFRQGSDFQELKFNGMTILRDGDNMVFKRGTKTLMILE
jgi:hypothetical protein